MARNMKIMIIWDVTLCSLVIGTNVSEEPVGSVFESFCPK
jgi:hypothetical protein